MNDQVNLKAFQELKDNNYLIDDLINIIKEYSLLPSWIYIGASVHIIGVRDLHIIEAIGIIYPTNYTYLPFYCNIDFKTYTSTDINRIIPYTGTKQS